MSPVCTATPRVDIGQGVSVEVRFIDGEPAGVAYWHRCNEIAESEDFIGIGPPGGWDLIQLDPLTVSPCLYCVVGAGIMALYGTARGCRHE